MPSTRSRKRRHRSPSSSPLHTLTPPPSPPISYILTLPTELLVECIERVLLLDPRDRLRPLILLSSVCRLWRSTLLSARSLWRQLSFTLPRDAEPTLFELMKRAYPAPMDLSITVWMDSSLWGDEDTSKMDALQEGLFVGIVRVRSLSLHVPMEEDARWFNQVIGLLGGDALSDLKSVEIDGFLSSRSESGDGAVALDMFSTLSPRLEKLTVCCLWCRWPSSPFEKLAVLEVDWFTRVQGADEWRNLSHCQNLQEMCLHFQEERDQIQHVYADVKFPLLRKLVIHSTENAANSMVGANLFERINCPSLRTLHFYSTKGYYRPFMLAITKSKRTYATVESLRIDWDFPCTDLMTHFPALDKLIIAPGRKAEDIRSRPTGCDSILNNRVQGALGSWPRCRVLDLREIACWYPSSYRCVYNELTKKRNVGRPKITLILPPWGPKRCMEHGLWEQLVQKTRVTSSDLKYH